MQRQNYPEQKISEIYQILNTYSSTESSGIMTGDIGVLVALCHLRQAAGTGSDDEVILRKIDAVYDFFLNSEEPVLSFADGLSGFCWFMEYVKKHRLLSIKHDTRMLFSQVDKLLYESMMTEIESGNFDYMHGAMGVGLYFLEIPNSIKHKRYVGYLINALAKQAIYVSKDRCKWPVYTFFDANGVYNGGSKVEDSVDLSLSHGIPSIISFLSYAIQANIEKKLCYRLLRDATNFVAAFVCGSSDDKSSGDKSPQKVLIFDDPSCPAWCRGYFSVRITLLKAYLLLGDTDNAAKMIRQMVSELYEPMNVGDNYDAAFCHGSSGIAYLYSHLYGLTGENEFKRHSAIWQKKTLDLASFPDGIAGYKTYSGEGSEKGEQWFRSAGLLNGIAGIGLSLFGGLSVKNPWERIFML